MAVRSIFLVLFLPTCLFLFTCTNACEETDLESDWVIINVTDLIGFVGVASRA